MGHVKNHLILTIALVFSFQPDIKATVLHDTGFWSLQLENDLFASTEDRFYTHGTEVSYASVEPPPEFLDMLTEKLPFYHKGPQGIHGFSIGQKIFTPEDIEEPGLIENDRPYAGWLYLDVGIAHVFEDSINRQKINGLILTLGVIGPSSYADEIQTEFHRMINTTIPQGWDNQLHDEVGVMGTYVRKWRRI